MGCPPDEAARWATWDDAEGHLQGPDDFGDRAGDLASSERATSGEGMAPPTLDPDDGAVTDGRVHPVCVAGLQQRKLASRIFRAVDGLQAARLWPRLDDNQRKTALTSGGRGTGTVLLGLPTEAWMRAPHDVFRIILRSRAGLRLTPP